MYLYENYDEGAAVIMQFQGKKAVVPSLNTHVHEKRGQEGFVCFLTTGACNVSQNAMILYIYKYGHRSAYALFFGSYFKLTANSKMYTEELTGISSILKTTNQNNYSDSVMDRGCISLLLQCLEQHTLF